ncbi:Retrovirus-related Pol polyprotein from type-1 retrotransposable element R2 [Frankliniella fusca]|uniref:Retrovirus-related Pol polyprotein from type-1 retrotransposable element R2 n=1 Tax=Frankliniella fusca TaxID=407009 RepID=A0AAE1H822_9NEOP|nr:Retrovirus-related Pol polyprotein from type-1 retrotransposable element R2 [Frankliniella fusca]
MLGGYVADMPEFASLTTLVTTRETPLGPNSLFEAVAFALRPDDPGQAVWRGRELRMTALHYLQAHSTRYEDVLRDFWFFRGRAVLPEDPVAEALRLLGDPGTHAGMESLQALAAALARPLRVLRPGVAALDVVLPAFCPGGRVRPVTVAALLEEDEGGAQYHHFDSVLHEAPLVHRLDRDDLVEEGGRLPVPLSPPILASAAATARARRATLLASPCLPPPLRWVTPVADGRPGIRVATWNVQGCSTADAMGELDATLLAEDVHLAVLQETRLPAQVTHTANYRWVVEGTPRRGHRSVAILVRRGVPDTRLDTYSFPHRDLVRADVVLRGLPFSVLGVHVPCDTSPRQRGVLAAVAAVVATMPRDRWRLLLGDFNGHIGREDVPVCRQQLASALEAAATEVLRVSASPSTPRRLAAANLRNAALAARRRAGGALFADDNLRRANAVHQAAVNQHAEERRAREFAAVEGVRPVERLNVVYRHLRLAGRRRLGPPVANITLRNWEEEVTRLEQGEELPWWPEVPDARAPAPTSAQLREYAGQLSNNTAPGPDGLPAELYNTYDHIMFLRKVLDERWRAGDPMYVLALDIKAAFPSVLRRELAEVLLVDGVPPFLLNRLVALALSDATSTRWQAGRTREVLTRRGVKQGCPLAPYLFTLPLHAVLRRVVAALPRFRLDLDGADFNPLVCAYADDLLVASTRYEDVSRFLEEFAPRALELGLALNFRKCEYMERLPGAVDPGPLPRPVQMAGREVQQVARIVYLGALLTAGLERRGVAYYRVVKAQRAVATLQPLLHRNPLPPMVVSRIYRTTFLASHSYEQSSTATTKATRMTLRRQAGVMTGALMASARRPQRGLVRLVGEELRKASITRAIRGARVRYWGHILRCPPAHPLRRVLQFEVGRKKVGRPCHTFNTALAADLARLPAPEGGWEALARDKLGLAAHVRAALEEDVSSEEAETSEEEDGVGGGLVALPPLEPASEEEEEVNYPIRAYVQFEKDSTGDKTRQRLQNIIKADGITEKKLDSNSKNINAQTIHCSQSCTYDNILVFLNKTLSRKLMYTACSRVTSLTGLYLSGIYKKPVKATLENDPSLREMTRMRNEAQLQFSLIFPEDVKNKDNMVVLFHNVRSLNLHFENISCDPTFIASDIIMLAETWSKPEDKYDLNNFTIIFRTDCKSPKRKAFGYLVYVKNYLLPHVKILFQNESISGTNHFTVVALIIFNKAVMMVYKSPKAEWN